MVERNDFLSKEQIRVSQEGAVWLIQGKKRKVRLDASTFQVEIKSGKASWRMAASRPDDLVVGVKGVLSPMSFPAAKFREVSHYDTGTIGGVMIHLKEFVHPEHGAVDLELRLVIAMEIATEEILFQIIPAEKDVSIHECRWPKMIEPESVDVTVVPNMQGVLIPRNFGRKIVQYDDRMFSRGFYMPWWGYQKDTATAMMIVETPVDAAAKIDHPAGGPTTLELKWLSQLGCMGYMRKVRFCAYEEGNYVTLCKRYRRYVMETGHFVSLKEKIARNPKVAHLLGSPVIHTSILYHMEPASSYYNKEDPSKNHMLVTFDERIEHLKKLSAMGVKKAYLHLDGWGYRGYDNLHPDLLPPCEEAGGWEGMKRFADACDKLNYLFAIHDQYRDYFHDSPAHDFRHEVWIERDGKLHYETTWPGGAEGFLCSSLMPLVQAKNHRALIELGINIKGAYIDVIAVVPPSECFNPEHPVTRRECLENWGRCLTQVRSILGVTSSEEPCDWAVPYLDLVHHGPYPLDPNPGKGPANGIPVPLFNLVYHDAIILPWSVSAEGKGGWGIPDADSSFLHAVLNAGMPYISLEPSEKELKMVKTLCAVQEKLALQEMVGHEFLDESFRRQRTTYGDGTTITVDFDRDQVEISPEISGG
jgi:hypothetical protein